MRERAAQTLDAAIAVAAWCALILQFFLSVTGGREATFLLNAFRYFGYFTILTNLFVALVATAPLLPAKWGAWLREPRVRAAGATYITMVSLAYILLLKDVANPQGLEKFTDVLLHYIVPALYVSHWLLFVEKGTLRWSAVPGWLAYPLAYFGWAMLRGELVGAYAYPFIDVNQLGYAQVTANAAGLVLATAVLGSVFVGADRAAAKIAGSDERTLSAGRVMAVDPVTAGDE